MVPLRKFAVKILHRVNIVIEIKNQPPLSYIKDRENMSIHVDWI